MDIEYLDKAGLDALWTKIKNTFVAGSTYSSNNNTIYNRLAALEEDVRMLKADVAALKNNGTSGGGSDSGGTSGGNTDSGGDSGSTGTGNGSISGNNEITVSGVSGDYTLVYLDASGNELTDYEEITQ